MKDLVAKIADLINQLYAEQGIITEGELTFVKPKVALVRPVMDFNVDMGGTMGMLTISTFKLNDPIIEREANRIKDQLPLMENLPTSKFEPIVLMKKHPPVVITREGFKDAMLPQYTGSTCVQCQSPRMVRNGTCEMCVDCGSTNGCS